MGELSEVHGWIETHANCRSHERLIAAHEGITPSDQFDTFVRLAGWSPNSKKGPVNGAKH